jgi:hypothetical protein
MKQYINNLTDQMIIRRDELISASVMDKLGDSIVLSKNIDRMCKKTYPDGTEVYAIDGKDIIKFYPMQFEQVVKGNSIKLKATQKYLIYH